MNNKSFRNEVNVKYQNIIKYKDIFKEGYIAGRYVKASSQDEESLDKNVILIPNLEYTKEVEEFINEVYKIADKYYMLTLKLSRINVKSFNPEEINVNKLGKRTIIALLTGIVRNERINEGLIKENIESGFIRKCLIRLSEIDQ